MISESWIQLGALLEDYMGSEVDREMANAIKGLAKGCARAYAAECVAEALADSLAMLEMAAKELDCHPVRRGVYVYWEGDHFVYRQSPLGNNIPRDEADVLLKGKGDEHDVT